MGKENLRISRTGNKINEKSNNQCNKIMDCTNQIIKQIQSEYQVQLFHAKEISLTEIINDLKATYANIEFCCEFNNTKMRPDGGLLYLVGKNQIKFPILISEVKNQGTNDLRLSEGKQKQAQGNAIERLGKNVIGLKTICLKESIFPFVCFGDGCDFAHDSKILDRVATIAQFGKLNKTHLYKEGPFDRGSFYFREKPWLSEDMFPIMMDIAKKSIAYYFAKYGEVSFI